MKEAITYMNHKILNERLIDIFNALIVHLDKGIKLEKIVDWDDKKVASSYTLFSLTELKISQQNVLLQKR